MKKLFKTILITICVAVLLPNKILAGGEVLPGYSDWSIEESGDPNEVSAIQYGRVLPKEWSPWQTNKPDSPYFKVGEDKVEHYAYDGGSQFWLNVNAKDLFTWDFKEKAKVTYFYADVDTYVRDSWTNYYAPPLRLYCDNTLIASTGAHDYLKNWNPSICAECRILKLSMLSGGGQGRNTTMIVGTWATTVKEQYSFVISWKDGSDWRFDESYPHLYGEDSQIPVTRNVYSHPITYQINYDLDGGEFVGSVTNTYTVLDEVILPSAKKKGYDFIGWLDNGKLISKIEKGNYRNINLLAKYERKKPIISTSYAYFDEEDKRIEISELLKIVNAKANDELDGDISKNIVVDYIKYEKDGTTINHPAYLDISKNQSVLISFSITNSGGKSSNTTRRYYILGKGEDIDVQDDINIYSRFIEEEYLETLNDNSIWRNDDYQEVLWQALEKMRR